MTVPLHDSATGIATRSHWVITVVVEAVVVMVVVLVVALIRPILVI